MTQQDERRLVSLADARAMLGIGRTTLYELIDTGDLERVHIGKRALITRASIDALVARLRAQAAQNTASPLEAADAR